MNRRRSGVDRGSARQPSQAHTDPLTGLANRLAFRELAECALQHSGRSHKPLSLITLDVEVEVPGDRVRVTASFGVAEAASHETTIDEVLGCADKALYHAKHSGRNRVSCQVAPTCQAATNPLRVDGCDAH